MKVTMKDHFEQPKQTYRRYLLKTNLGTIPIDQGVGINAKFFPLTVLLPASEITGLP